MSTPPVLALTQGDPAGIGPEQILGLLGRASEGYRPLVVAEAAALEAVEHLADPGLADRLVYLTGAPTREELPRLPAIPVLDPVATDRTVIPGRPTGEDAAGALAALDMGLLLAREGVADALITGPVSKASIARHCRPGFTGQTEYLSSSFGLEEYGRDYLMAFLGGDLQVALLSTHPAGPLSTTLTTTHLPLAHSSSRLKQPKDQAPVEYHHLPSGFLPPQATLCR